MKDSIEVELLSEERVAKIETSAGYLKAVKAMKEFLPGKKLRITIEKWVEKRTSAQCRYYNGVAVAMVCEALGEENNEIRDYFNRQHFGEKVVTHFGGRKETVAARTTTTGYDGEPETLTTEDFWKLVEFVQRWAAENIDVVIPDPDPRYGEWKKLREYTDVD